MNAMTKGLLTIAMLAATAACDGAPTASNEFVSTVDGPSFAQSSGSTLTFSSTQSGSTTSPQSATGGTGSISFTGSITTPTPCYEVSATHAARSGSVTVTVTTADAGGFCTQVVTNNNYQGSVNGLAAGTYTFTILHDRTTAYTSTVVVQ